MVARVDVRGPLGGHLGIWCRRPAVAGALAGLPGGAVFVLVSLTLMAGAIHDGDLQVADAGARWVVRLALGVLLGAAFGRLVGTGNRGAHPVAGGVRVAVLGAAFGALWWVFEALALAPLRPEICALVGEVGRGDMETSLAGLSCYLAYGVVMGAALWGCHTVALRALPAGARAARRLEVYIASHCLSCVEARRLAEAAARRFPGLDVRTIDVEAATRAGETLALPERVVAVPAYMLDGAVIALGNPDPEQLFARIASPPPPPAAQDRRRGGGSAIGVA